MHKNKMFIIYLPWTRRLLNFYLNLREDQLQMIVTFTMYPLKICIKYRYGCFRKNLDVQLPNDKTHFHSLIINFWDGNGG